MRRTQSWGLISDAVARVDGPGGSTAPRASRPSPVGQTAMGARTERLSQGPSGVVTQTLPDGPFQTSAWAMHARCGTDAFENGWSCR